MTSEPTDTSAPRRPVLPAGQIAIEAYWLIARHGRTYAAQILALSMLAWFVHFVTTLIVSMGVQGTRVAVQAALLQLSYIGAIVTVLVLGGTAIFISSQRAIVLGAAPTVGQALRLQKGELPVLRAVCVYWLVVHLVPTAVSSMGYLAEELHLDWFPALSTAGRYAFYWGWVLATAPLVVLSLPIVLFEGAADPIGLGRRRLDGNTGRLVVASALAFAPVAIFDILLLLARDHLAPADADLLQVWLIEGVLLNIASTASSFFTILVMSALVGAIYLRLSPRLERVYGVFD